MNIQKINLDLEKPFYRGSVQKLYEVQGEPDVLVSETSVGGSVFDVGTIFSIAGSDIGRAGFRHLVFQNLHNPASWQAVGDYLAELVGKEVVEGDPLLKGLLEEYQEHGVSTHHLGMIERASGKVFRDSFPDELSNLTLVKRYTVQKPVPTRAMRWHYYDYSMYHDLDGYVIPLECIVRYGVTSGSSILRKYNALSEKAKAQYMLELGLEGELAPWQRFTSPIIDFTTKYEPEDRNITRQEAALMSGISGELFACLNGAAILASYMVHWLFNKLGLYLWDLKWEMATQAGDLIFVDTIDTDSVRATLSVERGGHHYYVHFNKQAMRDYYRATAADWVNAVNTAKQEAARCGAPFTEILEQGQRDGRYPLNPEIDPVFMKLQERKFELIQRFIREGGAGNDYRGEAETIAAEEVDFFLATEGRELYQKLNAID